MKGDPRCGQCKFFGESGKRTCYFGYRHPLNSCCSSFECTDTLKGGIANGGNSSYNIAVK